MEPESRLTGSADERITALTEVVARLTATVEQQQRLITALQAGGPAPEPHPADDYPTPAGPVSRRRLIRGLGATAAVGATTVGASLLTATPAAAAPGNALVIGAGNDGATAITSLTASPTPNSSTFAAINNATNAPIAVYGRAGASPTAGPGGAGVVGLSRDQNGVVGVSDRSYGVRGIGGTAGVYGTSSTGGTGVTGIASGSTSAGVFGYNDYSNPGPGVFGFSENGTGIYGGSSGTDRPGVEGRGNYGPGIRGTSGTTNGVVGLTEVTTPRTTTVSGVLGEAAGRCGVTGTATTGTGVCGRTSSGAGILGLSDSGGVAGQFHAGRAHLYLVPTTTAGAPTTGTHNVGELYLDKNGALHLCKAAGTPGTWKLIG